MGTTKREITLKPLERRVPNAEIRCKPPRGAERRQSNQPSRIQQPEPGDDRHGKRTSSAQSRRKSKQYDFISGISSRQRQSQHNMGSRTRQNA